MHRLASAPSSASLPNVSLGQVSISTPTNDPWGVLHVNLLPLFNGEPLRVPIEDLNLLVKRHISSVISSAPHKALSGLEHDTTELLSSGMVTLNAKLAGIEDDKLILRVVELWGFFWDQVLTYVEGVLLPLQTDPMLASLYRAPKRSASPTRKSSASSQYHIDVRTVALRSFRDKVIVPLHSRLNARLSTITNLNKNSNEIMQETPPRMQQMLLVLSAQSRPRPQTLSLGMGAGPHPPHLSPGEAAVADLLRLVRSASRFNHQSSFNRRQSSHHHHPGFNNRPGAVLPGPGAVPAPNFLSGGAPRDRRGRIAGKKHDTSRSDLGLTVVPVSGAADEDLDTPRNSTLDIFTGQREIDFLESLRSPELPPGTPTGSSTTIAVSTRASVGGWGLGAGNEATGEGEEDEPLDWDQAQAVVERMVGMTQRQENGTPTQSIAAPVVRRRMT